MILLHLVNSKRKIMSKRKVCLFHEDDWAGQDVEYSGCEKCLAKNTDDLDHMYYEGIPLRVIINRPPP